MKNYRTNFSPLLLTLLAICMLLMISTKQPHHYFSSTEYDIRVVNGFTGSSALPIVIWCASPETDMGGRALQEGDDYGFTLTATNYLLWGNNNVNRVFCTVKWDQRRRKFDAFHVSRDTQRCRPLNMCLWMVKEDGFYFSNDGLEFNKDFEWT